MTSGPSHDESVLPWNFLALPPEQSDLDTSRFLVLPVPYDGTVSYRTGAREGPNAIIDASRQMEDYDLELEREICALGIHTLPEVQPHAAGPEATVQRVQEAVGRAYRPGAVMVTLGGEHSISVGAVRELKAHHPDLSVLMLDAHADFRDSYQGSPYSHATVGRRISESCPLAIVGVRSLSSEEREAMEGSGSRCIHGRRSAPSRNWLTWCLSTCRKRCTSASTWTHWTRRLCRLWARPSPAACSGPRPSRSFGQSRAAAASWAST